MYNKSNTNIKLLYFAMIAVHVNSKNFCQIWAL